MRPRAATLAVLAILALTASPVHAEDRRPAQRQILIDLSYALGQSHALRQACEGAGDQVWRDWMSRVLGAEAPDDSLDRRMREAFNTGYAAAQAQYPDCSPQSRAEGARVAGRARGLSRALGE